MLSDMWRRPILQIGSNTTGKWGCLSLRQAGADGKEFIKSPLKSVTFRATRAFHVTSNRWNTFQTKENILLLCHRNDRSRQPTGRGGTISPYRRLPFVQDRGPRKLLFFPLLRTPELSNMVHSRLSFPAPGVDLSLQERLDKLFPDDGPRVKIM